MLQCLLSPSGVIFFGSDLGKAGKPNLVSQGGRVYFVSVYGRLIIHLSGRILRRSQIFTLHDRIFTHHPDALRHMAETQIRGP
eukprot:CAMPEP_0183434910 /NCGR_PEP_ID=MMETSP0370-20130417/65352_1 /TAXON_ID=268820 /ORGANISM="Peridinium aciculiferum, Strain PAER-2" /LENGTH=82 /DNA_ID=CAMNT_0025621761 /DNA_START=167 /DNA_END=415 /DNA_ORIENTATION=-